MESFALNLKARAKELGISQADVARRAGLSERRYSNYVTGRREPDLATLVRIAGVLQTTPDKLLSLGTDESTSEPLAQQRVRAAISVLPPEDLERVAIMIEALASKRHTGAE
jgi:transcriptional regulator with XRE-family HTH domain